MVDDLIETTTFRTSDGHYKFNIMPFSLTNTMSTFQATLNAVFKSHLCKFMLIFFDNILVYNPYWDSHLEHLWQVFYILQEHYLFIKRSKCEFATQMVSYLGHIISDQGVPIDPFKIEVVVDWSCPHSMKALRNFLGLTGFYCHFVKGFAHIAGPLNALLCKDKFLWNDDTKHTFVSLKQHLTST